MTITTKSSITLPPEEHAAVLRLRKRLGVDSNVEVVRRALRLLVDDMRRDELREAYRRASSAVRAASADEAAQLDRLADEGIDP
jgi:Arc/MetJ-type ribon-helix-helix transcriptional regulator